MDAHRFDDLLRVLSGAPSRRGLARLLAGAAFGVLAGPGAVRAAAKRGGSGTGKKKVKRRKKATVCHEGRTVRVRKRAKGAHLAHGDTPGPCPCDGRPDGAGCGPCQECASGLCADVCGAGQYCEAGACAACLAHNQACARDEQCCAFAGRPAACCAGRCKAIDGDESNCGACGNVCADGGGCNDGRCCTRIFDPCTPGSPPCCAAERGVTCVQPGSGGPVCCGLEIHACPPGCAAGQPCDRCCSGRCDAAGRCAPLPAG